MARRYKFFLGFGALLWILWSLHAPSLPSTKHPIKFYSTKNDLKRVALRLLSRANDSILLEMYGLTDRDLIHKLMRKQGEGVVTTVLCDRKGTAKLPGALSHRRIKGSGLMHRKLLIIDGKTTLLGTANFTPPSLQMHDNIMVGIEHAGLAQFLSQEIETHKTFQIGDLHLNAFLLPDFEGRAIGALLKVIQEATATIHVAMFTFTHPKLIGALIEAAERGVKVRLSIDHYTAKGASKKGVEELRDAGIDVRESEGPTLYHHKCALIDERIFVMGSANWTRSAFSKNWDCLLIFEHPCRIKL